MFVAVYLTIQQKARFKMKDCLKCIKNIYVYACVKIYACIYKFFQLITNNLIKIFNALISCEKQ